MGSDAAAVAEWRRRKLGTEPPQHGTANGYNGYGCRCDLCRAAHAAKHREQYAARRARYLAAAQR